MSPESGIAEGSTTRYRIGNEPDATRAVVAAGRHSREVGLDAVDAQSVATAVSELTRNILKYAGSGELLVRELIQPGNRGLLLIARDRGPGIHDLEAAMADHFSSSGTLGLGLPGVRRMMDEFHIESDPGRLTSVSCLKWRQTPHSGAPHYFVSESADENPQNTSEQEDAVVIEQASFGRPCIGEYVSGDLALVERRGQYMLMALVDGLGHGPEAHRVSERVREFLVAHWTEDVVATLRRLHESLRGGIGAVVGVAALNMQSGVVNYAGIGNTAYRLFGSRNLRLVSAAGNLGHQIRSPQLQTHSLEAGDVIVMYSDGIKDRFDLEDYPQLLHQTPSVVARTIVERFGKSHDDACCLVMRRVQ